jgi:hypothetical protein
MGKNWKGRGGGGGGRGGGGGGRGGGGGGSADLPSVRGFACVAGTCDGAREREANRELVNLLNDALDELYPLPAEAPQEDAEGGQLSVQDALAVELAAVRTQSHGATQRVRSINTGMKGYVLAKINFREACPVKLVASIFKRVESTRLPCARNLCRIFPLQNTFYPNAEEMEVAVNACVLKEFGHVAPVSAATTAAFEKRAAAKRAAAEAALDAEEGGDAKRLKTEEPESSDAAAVADPSVEVTAVEAATAAVVAAAEAAQAAVVAAAEAAAVLAAEAAAVVAAEAAVVAEAAIAEAKAVAAATAAVAADAGLSDANKVVKYNLIFNRRNNDQITKQNVIDNLWNSCPEYMKYNYRIYEVRHSPYAVS